MLSATKHLLFVIAYVQSRSFALLRITYEGLRMRALRGSFSTLIEEPCH